MTATVLTSLTFDEFEQLPDQAGKLELLRGELIEMPPAKRKHNEVSRRVFLGLMQILADGHGRGVAIRLEEVYFEMGYQMGAGSWLQPDVSITHAGQDSGDYFLGSPALAVEVISDGNTADAVEGKVSDYLAHGGLEVWVVYPKRRHLWIYTPDGAGEVHTEAFTSNLLGGVLIDVSSFFV